MSDQKKITPTIVNSFLGLLIAVGVFYFAGTASAAITFDPVAPQELGTTVTVTTNVGTHYAVYSGDVKIDSGASGTTFSTVGTVTVAEYTNASIEDPDNLKTLHLLITDAGYVGQSSYTVNSSVASELVLDVDNQTLGDEWSYLDGVYTYGYVDGGGTGVSIPIVGFTSDSYLYVMMDVSSVQGDLVIACDDGDAVDFVNGYEPSSVSFNCFADYGSGTLELTASGIAGDDIVVGGVHVYEVLPGGNIVTLPSVGTLFGSIGNWSGSTFTNLSVVLGLVVGILLGAMVVAKIIQLVLKASRRVLGGKKKRQMRIRF